MQQEFDLPVVEADYHDLIRRPEVRIIDFTAPPLPDVRREVILFAARHHTALFVQKPLLPHLDEARQLVEIAEDYDVPLMVNHSILFAPGYLAVEPYLHDPQYLGPIYYCQIEDRQWMDVSDHPWHGKGERWVTVNVAQHYLALARHWFGDAESVYAMIDRDPSQRGVHGDTLSVVNVRFHSGVQCVILVNWCHRGPRPSARPREEVVIQGHHGCIIGNHEGVVITTDAVVPGRLEPVLTGQWKPDAHGLAMVHFIDALEGGQPFWCEGRDNLKTLALAEAAYLSAEEQRVVQLAELE
jgi:predicted dehydrogenase